MKVLIADDEPLARSRLREQLLELAGAGGPPIDIVAEVGDGQAALEAAQAQQPDVALLDIRMPGMDGIQAALRMAQWGQPPAVVFVTAYDEHALAAFDANAVDYLLKPIRPERLRTALQRANILSQAQREALGGQFEQAALSVSYRGALQRIPLAEVVYLRAGQKYVEVCHEQGQALTDESLKSIEERFPGHFLRVHRNALAPPGRMRELLRGADGQALLALSGSDELLEVSRRHLPEVRRQLKS
jgi:two-component system response regulator AlgR